MLVIVFGGLDGYGSSRLATRWATAGEADRMLVEAAAIALDAGDSGITALGIIAFFGLTTATFGRAILAGRILHAWFGWAALVIGVAGLITGVAFAIEGPTSLTINAIFRPVALAATAYFIALGIALRRLHPATSRVRPPTADAMATGSSGGPGSRT